MADYKADKKTICPNCGASNSPGYDYCTSCGEKSSTKALAEEIDSESRRNVTRTKTGIGLLIIAVLIMWIPYIDIIGFLVGAVGAILIILYRGTFGGRHEVYTIAAFVIFLVGFIVELVSIGFLTAGLSSAVGSGTPNISAVTADVRSFYIATISIGAFISISYVLILFDLESMVGKLSSILGFVSGVVITVFVSLTVYPIVANGLRSALSATPVNTAAISSATAKLNGLTALKALSVIPAIFFVVGYLTVLVRIGRGEIPKSEPEY